MINQPDVVSRGAVATLPALEAEWLNAGGSQVMLIVGLGIVALISLLVAAAAYAGDARRRSRRFVEEDDSDLFTTTPLPVPKEELARMRKERRLVMNANRIGLPRWVQLGSVIIALVITFVAAQRLKKDEPAATDGARQSAAPESSAARGDSDDGPEALDLTPDSVMPFTFRARDWVASAGGCAGRLEVTKGASAAWQLTARIHDERGQLIDTARASVGELREGEIVEFTFPRVPCEQIGAWEVSGNRRTP